MNVTTEKREVSFCADHCFSCSICHPFLPTQYIIFLTQKEAAPFKWVPSQLSTPTLVRVSSTRQKNVFYLQVNLFRVLCIWIVFQTIQFLSSVSRPCFMCIDTISSGKCEHLKLQLRGCFNAFYSTLMAVGGQLNKVEEA